MDGLPIPPGLFQTTGWGALSMFIILLGLAFYKGWITTGGENKRIEKNADDRIAANELATEARIQDLKEYYESRLKDKDKIIAEDDETIKFLEETTSVQGEQISALVKANETTEHVIEAIKQAIHMRLFGEAEGHQIGGGTP